MKKEKFFAIVPVIYGVIIVLSNIGGILIPNILITNELSYRYIEDWIKFQKDYSRVVDLVQYLTFILPAILCICYSFSKKENHFINLPIMLSSIGISGWVIYAVMEFFMLKIAVKIGYEINIKYVMTSSLLNISMESLVTFTLAYFITETIHRKCVLPLKYPEGHISTIPGVKEPSVKFLFIINYISVTLFPVLLMVIAFIAKSVVYAGNIDGNVLIILLIVLIVGLVITFSFISYFEKPLNKIKDHIRLIQSGDYKTKIHISTNDSFGEMSDIINDMSDSIDAKEQKILAIQNSVVTGMATMVESRDNSTGGHIMRTSDCVKVFINYLHTLPEYSDLTDDFCNAVIKAAPMHDLGKIAVDDAILRKPGKFTDEEYEKMKAHAAEGASIVKKVLAGVDDEYFKLIAENVAHYHHEKWNGTGYPSGLSGKQIPYEARVMALADVFDALVSKRCYKDEFSYDKAFSIIQDSLGSHFDPELGKEFINCRKQLEALYDSY